jgi:hypothetical protein
MNIHSPEATTFDGQRLWSKSFTRMGVTDVAADARGGLTLVLRDLSGSNDPLPQRVQRLDGATGAVSWEYVSDGGSLSEVAVHPEGTVFVTDEAYDTAETYLVALNGDTGAASRWSLPYGSYQASATGPIVRDDGSVVVLVNPHDDENHRHLQLATVAETTAAPVFTDLYLVSPDPYFDAREYRLIPHEDALLVAQRQDGTGLIRIEADHTMGPVTTLLPPGMLFSAAQVEYAVSDTTGVALIKRETGHDGDPTNVYKATFDPVTLAAVVTPVGTDPYVSLRFISSDGEVYASGEMSGNDTQVAAGLWAELGAIASLAVGPEVDVHSSASYLQGSSDSSNGASRRISVPQPLQTDPEQEVIRTTILTLKAALLAEGDPPPAGSCAAWLATSGNAGVAMLDALLLKHSEGGDEKDRFGHGIISRLPDKISASSQENRIAAFTYGYNPGQVPVGVPSYFAVTFNDYGAFFGAVDRSTGRELREGPYAGGTVRARVRILVHEVAHLLRVPGFRSDFSNDVFQKTNDLKVEQNCGRLVGGIQ